MQSRLSTSVPTLKKRRKKERKKSQTLAATISIGHSKILYTLIGMGSAALAAAVVLLTQVRRPEFPLGINEVTN